MDHSVERINIIGHAVEMQFHGCYAGNNRRFSDVSL